MNPEQSICIKVNIYLYIIYIGRPRAARAAKNCHGVSRGAGHGVGHWVDQGSVIWSVMRLFIGSSRLSTNSKVAPPLTPQGS